MENRIGLIVMDQGKITHEQKFCYLSEAGNWLKHNFWSPKMLRYTDSELVYKAGHSPVNIIIAPLNY